MGHLYIEKPRLRESCIVSNTNDGLFIQHYSNELHISPDSNTTIDQIKTFFSLLDGSHTIDSLSSKLPFFSKNQIIEYLEVLDENYLLRDGKKDLELKGKNGLDFIFELEDLYFKWQNERSETSLATMIYDGQAPQNVLVGYTFEYYHVTRRCHECVSPAIAKSHGKTRRKALDFFIEEYRHDKLLLRSLTALGYKKEEIEDSKPLPYTHALMNLLGKWAHTDLLTFMAGIFLFEGNDHEMLQYQEALAKYDLPPEFAKFQDAHGNINIEGDHGHVTRDFFADVEYISPIDQQRIIHNIRILHELQLRLNDNVLDYYSKADCKIPRSLDSLIQK